MISRCLILDVETSGLAPTDRVLEIGLILYSVTNRTTLAQFSALRPTREGNAAEHVNGISAAALVEAFDTTVDFHGVSLALFAAAEVVVAHNAEFDRQHFSGAWHSKPWLCTQTDFVWPKGRPGSSLVNLALAHGVGVASAHRALIDCQLIASLFDRMHLFGYGLPEMFMLAMRPKALYEAFQLPYMDRQLAKDAGFRWNCPGHEKKWIRRMVAEDADRLPFLVRQIEAER